MTTVTVYSSRNGLAGFRVQGHSGYAQSGEDIVCAAVSSAVELTANGITEIAKTKADIFADEASAEIVLTVKKQNEKTELLLKSFKLHMELLSEQYQEYLKVFFSEV